LTYPSPDRRYLYMSLGEELGGGLDSLGQLKALMALTPRHGTGIATISKEYDFGRD